MCGRSLLYLVDLPFERIFAKTHKRFSHATKIRKGKHFFYYFFFSFFRPRFWAMNNAWYFSETEWNVFGWLLLETVLSNCYKCLWTQGFVSFFCISIYNSLKLISRRIVLLLSIFMKVVTITLTFILTFFTSYLLVISFVFFIENIDSLLKTALKKNWYLSSKNVGKWNCNEKWNTVRVVLLWLRSTKDRLECCIFSGISSFISWKYFY